ncbi:hypothetical protein WISP_138312 [Willisornis vidua]|uniref:Uncharacterized protein n=1 Tax=Willisornis vidua TaxID=1566151 RepID=A0ABQ9CTH5_9PASS|nr:hypothetical protein WISP_138312 [Willisornis vidua]
MGPDGTHPSNLRVLADVITKPLLMIFERSLESGVVPGSFWMKCPAQLDKHILGWVSNWLMGQGQRVIVNGVTSDWGPVISGVPQGFIPGPELFSIFINDLHTGLNGIISKLQARRNWEELLTPSKAGTPCRETLTNQRTG